MEHKSISGGEQWLPFARSRIKALRATGLTHAGQRYDIAGDLVEVRVAGEHEYIRISGSEGVRYEFLCADAGYTEIPVLGGVTYGIPGAVSAIYPGEPFMTGSGVLHDPKPTTRYAQTLTDIESPSRWVMRTIDETLTVTNDSSKAPVPGRFYTAFSRPNQHFQSYHWWYNNDPKQLVTSVCATGNGRSWVSRHIRQYAAAYEVTTIIDGEREFGAREFNAEERNYVSGETNYTQYGSPGSVLAAYNRFDVAFSVNPPYLYLRATPITAPGYIHYDINTTTGTRGKIYNFATANLSVKNRAVQADLQEGAEKYDVVTTMYADRIFAGGTQRTAHTGWRHAAVHKAVDAEGVQHSFFVSTDTHGVFTFYRATDYSAAPGGIRNIPADLTKVVRVAYPAWVTVTSDSEDTTADHWQWAFNKTARKAATTPLNKRLLYQRLTVYRSFGNVVCISAPRSGVDRPTFVGFDSAIVERLQIFRLKENSTYNVTPILSNMAGTLVSLGPNCIVTAVLFEGSMYLCGTNRTYIQPVGPWVNIAVDASEFEPEYETTPGFVEVEISIEVTGNGATDFNPTVTVIDSEEYSDNGAFFMDAAYYIDTKRGKAVGATELEDLTDDDLLTGEIEVMCGIGTRGTQPFAYGNIGFSDITARAYGIEAMGLSGAWSQNVHAFYTVRRRRDAAVVKRLALVRGSDMANHQSCSPDSYFTPDNSPTYVNGQIQKEYFIGRIEQADLRFLSFLTMSYSRKAKTMPWPLIYRRSVTYVPPVFPDTYATMLDSNKWVHHMPNFLRPRFELRIYGEAVRTVDYSRPEVSALTTSYDPMLDDSVPAGVENRVNEAVCRTCTLVVQQYLAANHFNITNNDSFSFCPDGSYAVYADRRSLDMPLHPDSTEASGVFDVIYNHPKKHRSTHKDSFNAAFYQTRDYSFYSVAGGDLGGFGRCGIWADTAPSKQETP